MLFPYTPFYNELKAAGEIRDDIWFDPDTPNRIYYTREMFQSANFDGPELKWMMVYSNYISHLTNPSAMFRKHGLLGGILRYVKAVLDIPLRGRLDAAYNMIFKRDKK